MSSLYSKYCKEVMNLDIIEDEYSFITFVHIITSKISCLKVIDLYVSEEARGNNKWLELMNKVNETAKERNCKLISAQISKTSPEIVQKRTKHLCEKFNMIKTYEDNHMFIFSRSI